VVTADLTTRARAGDGDAFRELTEPHRRELLVHCYRMLGSVQDAEDVLQDTLLAVWQGLGGFEQRASLRTWLYRIATNRCLNVRRSTGRRPVTSWSIGGVEPPEPTRLGDVTWLEPFPDRLLEGAIDVPLGPEAHCEQADAISLAFVTALQVLPARQRAVLVLRDVLGYRADEVAVMIDSTVDSVKSALKRARNALPRRLPTAGEPAPAPESAAEHAIVAKLTSAYQSGDVDALIALITADACLSMPPIPLEYHGRDAVGRFYSIVGFRHDRRLDLVPTRANRQPAFGVYLRPSAGGNRQAIGLDVLTLSGDRISAITHFDASVLPSFGLPSTRASAVRSTP
jgi:RNA polymerase sigma-70 factor (ECF subfamily)